MIRAKPRPPQTPYVKSRTYEFVENVEARSAKLLNTDPVIKTVLNPNRLVRIATKGPIPNASDVIMEPINEMITVPCRKFSFRLGSKIP